MYENINWPDGNKIELSQKEKIKESISRLLSEADPPAL